MAGGREFDRGKLKELVLYLAAFAERVGDEGFGMVKLNKLLYRADFEAYRLLGQSITGEVYEKQEFGPVARDLPIVLDELGAAGRLHWQRIPSGEYTRKVPSAAEQAEAWPDLTVFTEAEQKVIADALRELGPHGGRGASDWSHEESAGWNMADAYGETIEYYTATVSTDPIPPEDLRRASEFVREMGWVTGTQ